MAAKKPTAASQGGPGADQFASPLGRYYWGVGAAGLDAAALGDLPFVLAAHPMRRTPMTPTNQKCYWVFRAAWGAFDVWLSGFPVAVTERPAEVNGEDCTVLETDDLATWPDDLAFEVRARP